MIFKINFIRGSVGSNNFRLHRSKEKEVKNPHMCRKFCITHIAGLIAIRIKNAFWKKKRETEFFFFFTTWRKISFSGSRTDSGFSRKRTRIPLSFFFLSSGVRDLFQVKPECLLLKTLAIYSNNKAKKIVLKLIFSSDLLSTCTFCV